MLQALLSFGAGIATAASPCILPMLPLVLGASAGSGAGGRRSALRPLAIVLGFVLSFALAALLFGASTRVLGISQDTLRTASITVLLAFGVLLVWPTMLERALAPWGGLADVARRIGDRAGAGPGGALLLGMSLGLLWTPCAGPVLASTLALIAAEQQPLQAAGLLLAYAAGAGLPMLAVAYGGQAVTSRVRVLARHGAAIRRGFGVQVLVTAAAMAAQVDTTAAAWLSRSLAFGPADSVAPETAPTIAVAPEFTGVDQWFNSAPKAA